MTGNQRSKVKGQGSKQPVTRREALGRLALASMAGAITFTPAEVANAVRSIREETQATQYKPKFFTAQEYATVTILGDLIIPRDARSGSASDAGVPQFMDFLMTDGTDQRRIAMRGGLAWLDRESRKRFSRDFRRLTSTQQKQILDDIAWPKRAKPEHSHGVAFFNSFRDLTASGFWSSKMGVTDLGYQGNVFVAEWKGCPQHVLDKLGVAG
ncbi:MAG TPA: gluconate 2-dehydrogenase subunit 3 family protein [Gemmatimonadaceae bacterium]|nr:gluconate 2-dehydrogenase subunit 3 family protein [Gemmatimonadaceae bacterium]